MPHRSTSPPALPWPDPARGKAASGGRAGQRRSGQNGFTMVEIAVVLVLIGLLAGMALKAQSLIDSGRTKRFVTESRELAVAIHDYQGRFRALPGDDRRASEHLSGALDGNGNSLIDGRWTDNAADAEPVRAWQHLRIAGLLHGSELIGSDRLAPGNSYLPVNPLGGRWGIQSNQHSPHPGIKARLMLCASELTGTVAAAVDAAVDNGDPGSGEVVSGPLDPATGDLGVVTRLDDEGRYGLCMAL